MSRGKTLNGYRYDPRLDPQVTALVRGVAPGVAEQMVDRMLAAFPGAAGIDGLRERLLAIACEYAPVSSAPLIPANREALEEAVAGCGHNGAGRPEGCVACKPWRAALLVTDDKEPAR